MSSKKLVPLKGVPWDAVSRRIVRSRYTLSPELRPSADEMVTKLAQHHGFTSSGVNPDRSNVLCSDGITRSMRQVCAVLLEQLPLTTAGHTGGGGFNPTHVDIFNIVEIDGSDVVIRFSVNPDGYFTLTWEGLDVGYRAKGVWGNWFEGGSALLYFWPTRKKDAKPLAPFILPTQAVRALYTHLTGKEPHPDHVFKYKETAGEHCHIRQGEQPGPPGGALL